jgi:hypothetical protein
MAIAAAIWSPGFMGYPAVNGYTYSNGLDVEGFNVADSHSDFALRHRHSPSTATLQFLMSRDQFRYFEGFYRHTLRQGAIWFQMELRVGLGLIPFDCHITDAGYQAEFIQGNDSWDVSFDVEFIGYDDMVLNASEPWEVVGGGDTWELAVTDNGDWETVGSV